MNPIPNRTFAYFLCFVLVSFLLHLSCNKDEEALRDAVFDTPDEPAVQENQGAGNEKDSVDVEDQEQGNQPVDSLGVAIDSTSVEVDIDTVEVDIDSTALGKRVERTAIFPPIHDAYLQEKEGFNLEIVRLGKNLRTSYLMFDLSQIDSVEGQITSVALRFNIKNDGGHGKTEVLKGTSNMWTETDLSEDSAPSAHTVLGFVQQEYPLGSEVVIDLNPAEIPTEIATLVLTHSDGDDFAFASKENKQEEGARLVVAYEAPESYEAIVIEADQILSEGTEEQNSDDSDDAASGDDSDTISDEEGEKKEDVTGEEEAEETSEDETDDDETSDGETTEDETGSEGESDDETDDGQTTEDETGSEGQPDDEENHNGETKEDEQGDKTSDDESDSENDTSDNNAEEESDDSGEEESDPENEAEGEEETSEEEIPENESDPESEPDEEETDEGNAPDDENSEDQPGEENPEDDASEDGAGDEDQTGEEDSEGNTSEDETGDESSGNENSEEDQTSDENPDDDTTEDETGDETSGDENSNEDQTGDENPGDDTTEDETGDETSGDETSEEDETSDENPGDDTTEDETGDETSGDETSGDETSDEDQAGDESSEDNSTDNGTEGEDDNADENPVSPPPAPSNTPPITVISANPSSGTAPLEVTFTGSDSSDDKAIVAYAWDFKDGGTSADDNTVHTFEEAGTYVVSLQTTDEEGLSTSETETITVEEPINEAPTAVAQASSLNGEAPFEIDFTGSSSSDDQGIVEYTWSFPGSTSTEQNTAYTFEDTGVFDVTLTVTDAQGLTDSATLSITVTEPVVVSKGQIPCGEGSLQADASGRKIWCWSDINLPEYSGHEGVLFANRTMAINSECYEKQITKSGNRLKFRVDPVNPYVGGWCPKEFNMRAEVRTALWDVRNPPGTEEWFGWSYTFGNDYEIDENNQWKFFQVHNGIDGAPPQIGLEVIHDNQFRGHQGGEIYVVNECHGTEGRRADFSPTGITPRAGQTIDVVVHAIWENASKGLLQVWINGNKVYDKQVSTLLPGYSFGGNAKWGIYKWPWEKEEGVQKSLQQGITHLETYMGTLRMITRKPGDPDYGSDSYAEVAPD